MMQLSQINIFPVKSLDGYSPKTAVVERRGLRHDRRWLIVDADGVFMTQRTNGRMALLRAQVIDDAVLTLSEKGNPNNSIKIDLKKGGNTEGSPLLLPPSTGLRGEMTVQIWDDRVLAALVSPQADAFLSDFLNKKCHLVSMPPTTERRLEEKYNTGDDIVSFADAYPFLILGEATMQDLNNKIAARHAENVPNQFPITINQSPTNPLSIRRFRANFIFSGGAPFAEDAFKNFKIGDVDFVGLKPCARCVLTTRDPDTGQKGKEPLETLATYRQRGTKILFGQNLIFNADRWQWAALPEVSVGDVLSLD